MISCREEMSLRRTSRNQITSLNVKTNYNKKAPLGKHRNSMRSTQGVHPRRAVQQTNYIDTSVFLWQFENTTSIFYRVRVWFSLP